jgi:hypothetical protein
MEGGFPGSLETILSLLLFSEPKMVVWPRETCNNCSEGICHLNHFSSKDSPGLFIRRQFGSTATFPSAVTTCANVGG